MNITKETFYINTLRQEHYDREIDEGMSSGMRRYVTLDISKLSKRDIKKILSKFKKIFSNFDICKLVQIGGFNIDGKRYLTISGECHTLFQSSCQKATQEDVEKIVKDKNALFVTEFIPPPGKTEKHVSVNLGPYGSTGAPTLGYKQHPDANKLRAQGLIR